MSENKFKFQTNTEFQNVFDFPDFIEMRPILRDAIHQIAVESFKQPVLPVKIERMKTLLEEQLERETRKYERQKGVYPNQKKEHAELIRLFTHVLQIISNREEINEEIEDIIYAIDQTRKSLQRLPELKGEGPLFEDDRDKELIPGTFYYVVTKKLVEPYMIKPTGEMVPKNVSKDGRSLVVRMTTYAYRDWDAYLTHQYDEQHNIKNEKGLSDLEYYNKLEENELKYADHIYSDVLADTFSDFEKLLVPKYFKQINIMSTDLTGILKTNPLIRIQLNNIIKRNFKLDDQGIEHVLDAPIQDIKNKYNYYRENFID